ncbi:hypothetical protein H7I41_04855 [Mycobacterium manitobense]|uniref:Peptide zinc metalloprotease protein n=1 Tax=[Mycobacterium] manitobense TaxID=190147 RepID=A0A9X2YK78_9MYCO|nr:hypothetical protein [[Mycobacterium] manitobense]MCV7169254.1 hypothetical protein [[Mycobacterium] manitobense]
MIAEPSGQTVLFEHPRAAQLPQFLSDDPTPADLAIRLGPPLDATVVSDLVELGILVTDDTRRSTDDAPRSRAVQWTRSGLMIPGIAAPARVLNRVLTPFVNSIAGKATLAAIMVAGVLSLLAGRPDVPPVSTQPALEVALMLALGLAATIAHELAHAVVLVHYGCPPRRAGFGFYWGAVSFFVDSTPALTLPRRARVIQALAGLAVDAVTVCVLAIAAQLAESPIWAIVCWRLAILLLVEIGINLAPVLQVDGHWALADWLDEPDLAPRARRALGAALRGRPLGGQRGLAVYGAASLAAGLALLSAMAATYWATTADLIIALFSGNPFDIVLGLYYVAPIALGLFLSMAGLIVEPILGAAQATSTPRRQQTRAQKNEEVCDDISEITR